MAFRLSTRVVRDRTSQNVATLACYMDVKVPSDELSSDDAYLGFPYQMILLLQ